jgi:glycosyltransferase involved in cell wall biosynthesis
LNILQVSASDTGGGAHKIANALHRGLRARGHTSGMAVARRTTRDPDVYTIPLHVSTARRLAFGAARRAIRAAGLLTGRSRQLRQVRRALRTPHPLAYLRARRDGREFFDYPGSRTLLELPPFTPDIVHCHNLHTGYFDLRYLATLSARRPVALSLHDEWTFTGHCAYTMNTERFRLGCHSCPDLQIYPAIEHDATHQNWLAKQAIYEQSRLYVTAPSRWLLERARGSILAAGVADWRLIPNGVDQQLFRPGNQQAARDRLDLPSGPLILLFTANFLNTSPFKDYATVEAAVERVAGALRDRQLLLIALGGEGQPTRLENAELRFVPYESEPQRVAAYYQAADLYLHAANADQFPTTILEALAAGRPVVATAVDGIEEQVRSLAGAPGAWSGAAASRENATGVLVAPHDAAGMAAATIALLSDDDLRAHLGRNAASDAAVRFDLDGQLDATLAWYAEAIQDWQGWLRAAS